MNIREPGKHLFYVVQWQGDSGFWHDVGGVQIARVPAAYRHGPKVGEPDLEPFQSWSASGEVWQKTGNHGFTKASQAFELAELLVEHDPQTDYRVVRVELEMTFGVQMLVQPSREAVR